MAEILGFSNNLAQQGLRLNRQPLETLQINLGKLCNQACHHCHVDAGPTRTEKINRQTLNRVLTLLDRSPGIQTVDITGGAPELNQHFHYLVRQLTQRKKTVIDRCNLTVLLLPGQGATASFLREQGVVIIASLPCYSQNNVDQQRGQGVFNKSIEGLKLLNSLGYGHPDSGLTLNLVYNPLGPSIPPPQEKLEAQYQAELKERFGILFNRLLTITNMPIKRFSDDLHRQGRHDEYLNLLYENFNLEAAQGIMCRSMVSVGWDGKLYDCDFNQMLEIPLGGRRTSLWDIESFEEIQTGPIAFGNHCYGCTAGRGSSCKGEII